MVLSQIGVLFSREVVIPMCSYEQDLIFIYGNINRLKSMLLQKQHKKYAGLQCGIKTYAYFLSFE